MQPRNMSMSGVVDLAAVKAATEAKAKAEQARAQRQEAGPGAAPASPLVIEVTEATFESDVLQRSAEVPVVISFWADQAEQSKQLNTVLERLAGQYRGRFVLATAEVYANQMLFQQFGVQGCRRSSRCWPGRRCRSSRGPPPRSRSPRCSTR